MKKFVAMLLLVILLMSIYGCGSNKGNNYVPNDETATQGENVPTDIPNENLKVYLNEIQSTGEIRYEDFLMGSYSTENIYSLGSCDIYTIYDEEWNEYITSDLFAFCYDEKYGYADAYGNIIIEPTYKKASEFFEDKAFVLSADDKWMIIDTKGNELMTLPQDYQPVSFGREPIGFRNGKAILPSRYDGKISKNVVVINEDMTTTQFTVKDSPYSIRTVNTPEFSGAIVYYFDLRNNHKSYVLYDLNGKEIWSVAVDEFGNKGRDQDAYNNLGVYNFICKNGYMNIVGESGKWGLIDLSTGEIKISCQYDYLGTYSDGLIEVCKYGKWGHIDINGNEVIKPEFVYATAFENGRAYIDKGEGQYAVIDKNGNVLHEYVGAGFTNIYGAPFNGYVFKYTKSHGIAIVVEATGYHYKLLTDDGRILLNYDKDARSLYISDKYIFTGNKMYEIVRK